MLGAHDDPAGEPSGRPSVAVVVATRDRPAALVGALEAVTAAVAAGDEVVVVDSASSGTRTRDVAIEAGVRYVRATEPGASRARNIGWRQSQAGVVAFTDDDCRPRAAWADALAAAFVDPDVGFALGPVLGAGGGSAADVVDRGAIRWRWPDDPRSMGSGACLAVRRSALASVGGFDERLGPGAHVRAGEDHELLLRLLRAGWHGAFEPHAVVDHDDRRGRWATLRLFYDYGVGAGTVAAMARSLDRATARRMLLDRLWGSGLRAVARDLSRRWEEPAARGAAMTVGVVVGAARSRRLRSTVPPPAPSPASGRG